MIQWEALSLVPERNVEGLISRKWERLVTKKTPMMMSGKRNVIKQQLEKTYLSMVHTTRQQLRTNSASSR